MPKKTGLGKGLDALFIDNEAEIKGGGSISTVRVKDVEPNKSQPRHVFDQTALDELANSIREHGVIQPITVRPMPGGTYQIITGERRWRASRQAGLLEIPAVIMDATDDEVREMALIENIQREDLTPMEEAEAYQNLMNATGMTQEQMAQRLGKSRPVIANALRLLNLPQSIQEKVSKGIISAGHGRLLASLEDAEAEQWAKTVEEKGLSVRELENNLKKARKEKPVSTGDKTKAFADKEISEMQLSLQETTGRRIKIEKKGEGGTISIEFFDEEDLKALALKLEKNKAYINKERGNAIC